MKAITEATVAQMCREMVSRPSLSEAMDYLEAHQPNVLYFLMHTFANGRTEAGMKACQLGWCVYRAFELESEQPIPQVGIQQLADKAWANQQLLMSTKSASLEVFVEIMGLEMAGQPVVMQFVRQALATGLTDDRQRNRELVPELVAIFLAVKTVVDVLDAITN
jgi:hypothetical protein